MSNKCEKKDCNNVRSCFHYCSEHHQEICMKGIVNHANLAYAMQARIEKLETGLRRIVNGEYDNARTIDAAEKFARELLRGE